MQKNRDFQEKQKKACTSKITVERVPQDFVFILTKNIDTCTFC